ncbi:hypothetical protein Fot_23604 [Forsythia ovata]|uniref:KIB1-4 beta-propeller domain-containing protein n=1 Tax=Forsythia ovata TaxID=205694 RepID=A0ABD1V2Y9_9LAMI
MDHNYRLKDVPISFLRFTLPRRDITKTHLVRTSCSLVRLDTPKYSLRIRTSRFSVHNGGEDNSCSHSLGYGSSDYFRNGNSWDLAETSNSVDNCKLCSAKENEKKTNWVVNDAKYPGGGYGVYPGGGYVGYPGGGYGGYPGSGYGGRGSYGRGGYGGYCRFGCCLRNYHGGGCGRCCGYAVYKFDILKSKWMASVDLGNRLLFIDEYGCTSVSACGYFKPNCIYFAQDNLGFSVLPQQEQNMTVYSIKDHNFVDY